ncbi:helix-turn-helix domain-containing protein [Candidatus Rhodobacter oscarellae]|uniref:helix-turn-helix domain-containing protein n=1 Tax=Candidatus Rhodobacter oscarellae TaxID=1675527 RepID=UPI000670B3C0|nr:helix-turn-helix domain-containing protein [Candidatus Rhodobacter lobularis]
MPKRFPAHGVKTHRIYTVWEIAECLRCHRHTVTRWIKARDLDADRTCKPWLIRGADLKAFLGHRQAKPTRRMAPHHCFCLGCKSAQIPDGNFAEYTHQTPTTGRLTALCPACGVVMSKVIRRTDLEAIQAKIEVAFQQAAPRLVSLSEPSSEVALGQEDQTHAKAS